MGQSRRRRKKRKWREDVVVRKEAKKVNDDEIVLGFRTVAWLVWTQRKASSNDCNAIAVASVRSA